MTAVIEAQTEARSRPDKLYVAWVEDEWASVESVADALQAHGIYVESFGPADVADLLTRSHEFAAYLIDLRWRNESDDGRALARRLIRMSPDTPIVFVSNFFADDEYVDLEKSLAPYALVSKIEKYKHASEANRSSVDALSLRIHQAVDEAGVRWDRSVEEALARVHTSIASGFRMTPEEYRHLSFGEKASVVEEAFATVEPLLRWIFRTTDVDWVIMAGEHRDIMRWGLRNDRLDNRALIEFVAREGVVPMAFHRPSVHD